MNWHELYVNFAGNLHEVCGNLVDWVGYNPESTVATWVISSILMLVNSFLVSRKVIRNRRRRLLPDVIVDTRPQIRYYPYVPSDTVLKILKLLNKQETGWEVENSIYSANLKSLCYGKLLLKIMNNRISISYNGVNINIGKSGPEQDLLVASFTERYSKEKNRLKDSLAKAAIIVEKEANRELGRILDVI
jgi:hypothetical protein